MKNSKTTIAATLFFIVTILKNFGIDIPSNIVLDLQGVLVFFIGFFAQDFKEIEKKVEAPEEDEKK